MRITSRLVEAAAIVAAVVTTSSAAMAGATPVPTLPAPGIIGLVAGGVIAAIAVARLRK